MKVKRTIPGVIVLLLLSFTIHAQQNLPGRSDLEDLQLKECPFEKDAKAMVLADEAEMTASHDSLTMTRHKRIKLFKNYAPDLATIHLPYNKFENVSDIEAKVLKLQNGEVIATRIDPKSIYKINIDKEKKEYIFTFPAIEAGCIIEYKYHWKSYSPFDMPVWFFQSSIPVALSKLDLTIASNITYDMTEKGDQPFAIKYIQPTDKNIPFAETAYSWAKVNIHSWVTEPYSARDNNALQYISFQYNYKLRNSANRVAIQSINSWPGIVYTLYTDDAIANNLSQNTSDQKDLIARANNLGTTEQKIAFLFNTVKQNIKWNKRDRWHAEDGVRKAWMQKTGNSTEINLILFNLLKKANINANVMFVCTPSNGWLDPNHADISQVNKVVVYVPVDSTRNYVLDASNKYNTYNEVPISLLNTYGIYCQSSKPDNYDVDYHIIFLKNERPAVQVIFTDAKLLANGKIEGTTTISSYSYNKKLYSELTDDLDSSAYINKLRQDNNRISITDLSIQNKAIDSLPLEQKFSFSFEPEIDNNALYLKTNLFGPLSTNPFLSTNRYTNIDFSSCNTYKVNANYTLPLNYNVDLMPKNIQLNLFDNSIIFKRLADVNNNVLTITYSVTISRSTYKVAEYTAIHDFYKKVFEFLNEPVVLKKI